jgi:hypothetical protein
MSRQYSNEDATAFTQVEPELRKAGLDVDDPQIGVQNAALVSGYFDQNPTVAVTRESIRAAVFGPLKDALVWKTAEQIEFENIYATLASREKEAFDSWSRPQRLINSHANNLAVLKYLKQDQRYTVDARTLLQAAVDRIPGQLEWESAPVRVDPRQHKDDHKGFAPKDTDQRYVGGRINHAYVDPATKKEAPKRETDAWEAMSKQLLNNGTHSQQAEMRELFDNLVNQGKSWRQVYSELSKARKAHERLRF